MVLTPWKPLTSLDIWEPIREIGSLQAEMNRLFDRFTHLGTDGGTITPTFRPAFELLETPDALLLKVEIPGLEAKDIDVEVTEDSVSICGERPPEPIEEKGVIHSGIRYGRFERVIPLPVPVQFDQVKADYRNGILSLTLPKVESVKRPVVKVNLG